MTRADLARHVADFEAARAVSAPARLSKTQAAILADVRAHGGRLVRYAGGFWSTPAAPGRTVDGAPLEADGTRRRHVDVRTVRALERLGLVKRAHVHAEEWRDDRILREGTP